MVDKEEKKVGRGRKPKQPSAADPPAVAVSNGLASLLVEPGRIPARRGWFSFPCLFAGDFIGVHFEDKKRGDFFSVGMVSDQPASKAGLLRVRWYQLVDRSNVFGNSVV